MTTLSVPSSASLHHARASSKYAASNASTATESDDGYVGTPARSTPKPSSSPGGRRENKRQSLPTIDAIPAQKASPLRRRSSPSPLDLAKKPVEKKLTKNYTHMVKDFNMMKKYSKQANGEYLSTTLCVFCEIALPRLVFFPCQHRCVCDRCMALHDITNEPTTTTSWTACPVCMADIKLMLPHTGDEETMYWKWALEYPPSLPAHFREDFKEAAKRLGRGSSSVQPGDEPTEPNTPDSQSQSPPSIELAKPVVRSTRSRRSISGSQHSVRRFSLASRRYSTTGGAAAAKDNDNARCTIL